MSQNGNLMEQHMKALKRANEVRYAGARIRRDLAGGKITLKQAFKRKAAQPLRVGYLVSSLNRWGERRTLILLDRLGLSRSTINRRLRELTERQKKLILKGTDDSTFTAKARTDLIPSPQPIQEEAPRFTAWIDGPSFVKWLKEQGLFQEAVKVRTTAMRTKGWRKGQRASVLTVDRVLERVGRSLGEIPDDLYTGPPE